MNTFRRIKVLISFIILLTLLTSCTDKKKTVEDTSITNNINKEYNRDEIYPAFDMAGRTIRVACIGCIFDSSFDTIEDYRGYNKNNEEKNAMLQIQLDNVRRIEEKYNVKIENVFWKVNPGEGYDKSFNRTDYDICMVQLSTGLSMLSTGVALSISEFAQDYTDIMSDQIIMRDLELFGEPCLFSRKDEELGINLLGYNADLIKQLELEDPQVLYDKDEWTWEKFAEYAKLATKDFDGDGIADQYGLSFNPYMINGFIYANNGIIADSEKSGLSSPNVIEAMQYFQRLYQIDQSAISDKIDVTSESSNLWQQGKVLFWNGITYYTQKVLEKLDFEFHVIPYPLGPHGDGSMYEPQNDIWYMIPKGVENPDKVYQIFEEYVNWFNFDTKYLYGFDTMEYLSEKDLKLAYEVGSKRVIDIGFIIGGRILGELHQDIMTGETTVEESIDIYEAQIQEKLNELFHIEDGSVFGVDFLE